VLSEWLRAVEGPPWGIILGQGNIMKTIAFIVTYFGPFPPWIEYFLRSCELNSSITFFFYSDNATPKQLPENVHYTHCSFDQYIHCVSQRLEIDFCPTDSYKLCDIKPALGHIHKKELEGYNFWGACDIDLVWGDMRKFLTEPILHRYDTISSLGTRIAGHCLVLQNTEACCTRFTQVPGWKDYFEDPTHYAFDEKAFSDLHIRFKNHPRITHRLLNYVFKPYSRRALLKEQYSTPGLRYNWTDGSRNFPKEWTWDWGRLTTDIDGDREFFYFHFLQWKRQWAIDPMIDEHCSQQPQWTITERGFLSKK
jgi:hypothetical protein